MPAPALTDTVAEIDRLIDDLHTQGRLRIWSLIVTILGDAVVPRGGKVPLGVLQPIMTRLRVEPGAVRTALSRLASEGWVERERDGRRSIYRLAERGKHAFDRATKRVYASKAPSWDGEWTCSIGLSALQTESVSLRQAVEDAGFLSISPNVYLRPETSESEPLGEEFRNFLVLRGRALALPSGIEGLWGLDLLAEAYSGFIDRFGKVAQTLEKSAEAIEPVDALALRTLLIHYWRRIVLRTPLIPAELLGENWPEPKARRLAKRIYARVAPASEDWLDGAGMPAIRDLARFSSRFGILTEIESGDPQSPI